MVFRKLLRKNYDVQPKFKMFAKNRIFIEIAKMFAKFSCLSPFSLAEWDFRKRDMAKIYLNYFNKFKLHHLYFYLHLCVWINLWLNINIYCWIPVGATSRISGIEGDEGGTSTFILKENEAIAIPLSASIR